MINRHSYSHKEVPSRIQEYERTVWVYWTMEVALDAKSDDGVLKTEEQLAIEAVGFAFDELRQCERGIDTGPSIFRAEIKEGHVYIDAATGQIVSRVP